MTTPVIFRKFKDGDEIIAIFPTIPVYRGYWLNLTHCESYMRVGQHGACQYPYIINETVLATPDEYAGLLIELQSIGYDDLKVYKRQTKDMLNERLSLGESDD